MTWIVNPPNAPGPARLRRALVVEDNEINQRVVGALLRRMGYEVIAVENGQLALDRFREGCRPDVVLMDLQMPVMDGYEATRQMRAWEASQGWARTPIIAVTANAFDEFRERCLEVGMDDFLTKPLLPQALSDTIERCLTRRQAA